MKSIAAQVVRNGGEIIADEVVPIERDGNRRNRLPSKSGRLSRSTNWWSAAAPGRISLPANSARRCCLRPSAAITWCCPNPGVTLSRSLTYASTPGAATPMEMGLRLAGSDEFAGLDAPNRIGPGPTIYGESSRTFCRTLNGPGSATTRWMGHRPGTPDSLPVISLEAVSNVWYGFGHGHMGLTWGPSTGRLLSELMSGARSNIDLAPFRVDRF